MGLRSALKQVPQVFRTELFHDSFRCYRAVRRSSIFKKSHVLSKELQVTRDRYLLEKQVAIVIAHNGLGAKLHLANAVR